MPNYRPQKQRQACDRCHTQKLRCLKHQGASCDRCLKTGDVCVFSPSMRGYRPRPRETETARMAELSSALETIPDPPTLRPSDAEFQLDLGLREQHSFVPLSIDWDPKSPHLFQGFDMASGFEEHVLQNENIGLSEQFFQNTPILEASSNIGGQTPPSSNENASSSNASPEIFYQNNDVMSLRNQASLTREMVELLVGLGEHAASLPPLSLHGDSALLRGTETQPDIRSNPIHNSNGEYEFSLDQTFYLTEKMIDLYPRFTSIFLPQNRGCSGVDQSSIFLLLSCHHRLIDIWECLFGHVQSCMRNIAHSNPSNKQTVMKNYGDFPKLQIGDFSSSPSSVLPMEFMMVIAFMAQLLDSARELVAEISSRDFNGDTSHFHEGGERHDMGKRDILDSTKISSRAVMQRADVLVKMTHTIRRTLIQLGVRSPTPIEIHE